MRSFALAASGRDRSGIVAAVTGALLEHRVNVEDAEMAILRGHFAIVLVLGAPDDLDEVSLRADLDRVRETLPLEVLTLSEVETFGSEAPEATHAVSVYGADRPGIVHAVTAALAERDVNVVGLTTRVVGEEPLYVMLLEVSAPGGIDEEALANVTGELGVDVSVRSLDADVL